MSRGYADAVTAGGSPSVVRRLLGSPISVWGAFVLAHLELGLLALYAPGLPLGDVSIVYRFWMQHGFETGEWVGIDTSWVYPIAAILPMLASWTFGPDLYPSTWLSLVMAANAAAFGVLVHRSRDTGSLGPAWWWVGFLVLLGPISVARIDAFTVALALPGLLLVARMPVVATALLTMAAWLKVWPAALAAAAFTVLRERLAMVAAALTTSGIVVLTALALGAGPNVLSFVTEQTRRGLQIESVLATPWMWDAALNRPGGSSIYYDPAILTYQLRGAGTTAAASIATPLLAVVVAAILGLAFVGVRRRADGLRLLPPLALALTTALIVCNKVGSPQFVSWLAVPILAGLVAAAAGTADSFRTPAVLGLVIAGLTHAIYPYLYWDLVTARWPLVVLLTARNALLIGLLAWAVVQLTRVVRGAVAGEDERIPLVAERSSS